MRGVRVRRAAALRARPRAVQHLGQLGSLRLLLLGGQLAATGGGVERRQPRAELVQQRLHALAKGAELRVDEPLQAAQQTRGRLLRDGAGRALTSGGNEGLFHGEGLSGTTTTAALAALGR